ncbi:Mucin-16 [Camelus dromedarius]|uniref:Mucin-16 n=1 Tax=Camelus dromedarius TaxID=9838 RepID=A0A5N4CLX5_CAMDR|nr:Mucin-16 [Camelus dromedarius]
MLATIFQGIKNKLLQDPQESGGSCPQPPPQGKPYVSDCTLLLISKGGLQFACWGGRTRPVASGTWQAVTTPPVTLGSTTETTLKNSTFTGARDSAGISTTSTLMSEERGIPANFSVTSASGVKTTSPSTTSVPDKTSVHPPTTAEVTVESLPASAALSEPGTPSREDSWATTSAPSPVASTADSRPTSAARVSRARPGVALTAPASASERHRPSTSPPESSDFSQTSTSSAQTEASWTSAGTRQHLTGPQLTRRTDTSPGVESSSSEASPVTTVPATWVVPDSTAPSTGFTEITPPRETSAAPPTLEATYGPTTGEFTPSTEILETGSSGVGISQDTTELIITASESPETATDVTLDVTSAPESLSAEVITWAAGSSAPGETDPSSSKGSTEIPETSATGTADSWEGTRWDVTPSLPVYHFSPDMSPAGDITIRTSGPPLLSASVPDDTLSWFSTSSDHSITSSEDPGRTEPSSPFPISGTANEAETSAERVTSTPSPLAHPSPSGEATARSVLTFSTRFETTDSPSNSTTSTLALERSSGSGPLDIISVPGIKTSSPSTTSVSKETTTHPSLIRKETKETFSASVVRPETSVLGRENNLDETSPLSPDYSTSDSRSPHTASERHSPSTSPPESSDFSQTSTSSAQTEASWTSAGTRQHLTGPQLTRRTDTSPGVESSSSEASPVTTVPATWVVPDSTAPSTGFTEITPPREKATYGPTTGEFTPSTEILETGSSGVGISQDTTELIITASESPETATDVTLDVTMLQSPCLQSARERQTHPPARVLPKYRDISYGKRSGREPGGM